eukprot:Filipodium_phascolosomae@DN1598_c0_g1_i1.p2
MTTVDDRRASQLSQELLEDDDDDVPGQGSPHDLVHSKDIEHSQESMKLDNGSREDVASQAKSLPRGVNNDSAPHHCPVYNHSSELAQRVSQLEERVNKLCNSSKCGYDFDCGQHLQFKHFFHLK